MDLYLITGFLGAGKTTFLKNFIRTFAGQRLYLIINEFGKVRVDGALLSGLGAQLAEINNGSIFCACRLDKFEEALADAVARQPDVLLVEASGLADPTGICGVLGQEAFSGIVYRGSICLADAVRLPKVLATARVCRRQLAVSSLVLLNKSDLATAEQRRQTREAILAVNPATALHETVFGAFESAWLKGLTPQPVFCEDAVSADITLQKACVEVSPAMTSAQLVHFLEMLSDATYRMKGFVAPEGVPSLVDCVGGRIAVSPFDAAPSAELGRISLMAGAGMPLRKSLRAALDWYPGLVRNITDR